MHADEVAVDAALVRELLVAQAPRWAGLPLAHVPAWGTDHAVFRLGRTLSVRLPKVGWAAGQGDRERRWLPRLAPHLPVAVPVPVFVGEPSGRYPLRWYVAPWLEGSNPIPGSAELGRLARELADVVLALQSVDTAGAPCPAPGDRGGPLREADAATRASAERLRGDLDVEALLEVWEAGVDAPEWQGPGRWVHGDLLDGNLLVDDGRLTGVIDWGSCRAADPAVDLMAAWSLFDEPSRLAYRQRLGHVDEMMWLRGRAWAVSAALRALPYYAHTNPDIVARSRRTVRAVLADARP